MKTLLADEGQDLLAALHDILEKEPGIGAGKPVTLGVLYEQKSSMHQGAEKKTRTH